MLCLRASSFVCRAAPKNTGRDGRNNYGAPGRARSRECVQSCAFCSSARFLATSTSTLRPSHAAVAAPVAGFERGFSPWPVRGPIDAATSAQVHKKRQETDLEFFAPSCSRNGPGPASAHNGASCRGGWARLDPSWRANSALCKALCPRRPGMVISRKSSSSCCQCRTAAGLVTRAREQVAGTNCFGKTHFT